MNENNALSSTRKIAFCGVMAALIYAATLLRIPFLGSKVHFANAFCLLAGLLLGPVSGGIAAGMGSAIYDLFAGYDFVGILITFVSKFAMALVCGLIFHGRRKAEPSGKMAPLRTILACIAGALTYVLLYMLKTYIYQRFVYGVPMDAITPVMWSKFVPSIINALFAIIAAPLLFYALKPGLKVLGLTKSH